jgi:hypothetical protein
VSVVGATLRASNIATDFALLELNTRPPTSHNVFYAGCEIELQHLHEMQLEFTIQVVM